MADIVLGIGTSHTPLLSLKPELWFEYARGDAHNPELAYPPHGWVLPFDEAPKYLSEDVRARFQGDAPFADQAARFKRALDTLAETLQAARPDATVIISDDQDEWFYEHNMPRFAIYWGDSAKLMPRTTAPNAHPDVARAVAAGYGDVELDVPVASGLGRHLLEFLLERDFDLAHSTYVPESSGGRVQRRYPTPDGGETQVVRETPQHFQGLPHGFAFIVKRLFDNRPRPILPVFQNTCYPPNQPSPRRSYAFGQALAEGIKAWDSKARVAIIASGGLSHFVVDEELDRTVIEGLQDKDAQKLQSIPKERLYSAASESLNWIALGGALEREPLRMELLDYVPVYRTPSATGGGWTFARWQ